MHKIDTPDATETNEFTEGTPGVAEATEVDAAWLNSLQNEVCNVVESAGITLDKAKQNQLLEAISNINTSTSTDIEIGNNISAPENLLGIIFDKAKIKSADLTIDLYRSDNSYEVAGVAYLYVVYYPNSDSWKLFKNIKGDDGIFDDAVGAIDFTINSTTGQLKYTTSNMTNGNHYSEVKVKITNFKKTIIEE